MVVIEVGERSSSKTMSMEHSCCSSTCNVWMKENRNSGAEEGGCNYFKWFTDVAEEERGTCLKFEGKQETLLHSEEMDSNRKMKKILLPLPLHPPLSAMTLSNAAGGAIVYRCHYQSSTKRPPCHQRCLHRSSNVFLVPFEVVDFHPFSSYMVACLVAIQSVEVACFPLSGSSCVVACPVSSPTATQSIEVALFPFSTTLIEESLNFTASLSHSSMVSSTIISSDLPFITIVFDPSIYVFSPMEKMAFVSLFIVVVALQQRPLYTLNVNNVFLNDDLQEDIYMEQSPSFVAQGKSFGLVFRLLCRLSNH
ncbi:hypothetical protein V8G54_035566 [Vigna mungo]|uniref:Reverse transcriptase Ty1/copia-type domain-containing protein n=1 Tax=Vigna mungo TaxID=3915 RepID=A0AAQ3MF83_VIGMU